jgi:carbon-monoxide dehydrogenase medium subunit
LIPKQFEYYRAISVHDAISFLSEHEEAKVLAGGQSLIPIMKLRLASPKYLIDVSRIPGLAQIEEQKQRILIGSLTTHAALESSSIVRAKLTALSDAASQIGDQQVRNFGTIGGSLAHADPSADYPAVVLALGAQIEATGRSGSRSISANDFFQDAFTTSLRQDEIITSISFPKPAEEGIGSSYVKFERKAGDFATVGAAAFVALTKDKICKEVRVGLTSVASTPVRAIAVENSLTGKRLTSDLIQEAADLASADISPPPDLRGSAEYKSEMAKVFVKRALRLAVERAGGE